MKDFDTKLKKLLAEFLGTHVKNLEGLNFVDFPDESLQPFKTLFADTLLKAIGEDEKLPIMEMQPYLWAERNARNYQRADIKAKVFKELGIKEKV